MTEDVFLVEGRAGKPSLSGEIIVSGAKNAALQALAFSILFRDTLHLSNIPEIEDIKRMIELISSVGVHVTHSKKNSYETLVGKKLSSELPREIANRFRASVVVTGPLLARLGRVSFPHPGGCLIGARPIDLFIEGFSKMGAEHKEEGNAHIFTAPSGGLLGADIFLRTQSVTGTQTLMLAAVLAKGKTTIKNAAMEPEIAHLAFFLNSCGAKIFGAGTHTIEIIGGELLSANGKTYETLPDRIEAGSFLILASLLGTEIAIKGCEPGHLESLLETLTYTGSSSISISGNTILVQNKKLPTFRALDVKTHEYPGFPTDLQPPMALLLTQAQGTSLLFETIFEGRFSYVPDLVKMGADITMCDPHRIIIRGKKELSGRTLEGPDIRAGLALLMSGILAKGESVIHNVYYIDRGYEGIEQRLSGLGVSIRRSKL